MSLKTFSVLEQKYKCITVLDIGFYKVLNVTYSNNSH